LELEDLHLQLVPGKVFPFIPHHYRWAHDVFTPTGASFF
jgi:hypothetical protein